MRVIRLPRSLGQPYMCGLSRGTRSAKTDWICGQVRLTFRKAMWDGHDIASLDFVTLAPVAREDLWCGTAPGQWSAADARVPEMLGRTHGKVTPFQFPPLSSTWTANSAASWAIFIVVISS